MTLSDGTMTVELHTIESNPHADALLVAYLPNERLLVQADMYSPTLPVQPFAPNLLENLQRLGLRIDRMVSLHGPVVPYAEFLQAARQGQ